MTKKAKVKRHMLEWFRQVVFDENSYNRDKILENEREGSKPHRVAYGSSLLMYRLQARIDEALESLNDNDT